MAFEDLKIRVTADGSNYKNQMTQMQSQALSLEGAIRQIGPALMATFGIYGAIRYAKNATSAFYDFEQGLANTNTLLSGNNERIKEFKTGLIDLSLFTGQTLDDFNAGMYQVISAFGDSAQAMTAFSSAARNAVAGVSTTKESIDLTIATLKGYNLSLDQADRVSDIFFQTVKLGVTTFGELSASMGQVIPIASAVNVSMEELFGLMATLTGVTGNTAIVATQVRGMFNQLQQGGEVLTPLMKSLGYATASEMIAANGLMGSFELLYDAVDRNNDAFGSLFSNIRAKTAALALMSSQSENAKEKIQAMYEATGAANKAFEVATDTLSHRFNVAIQAVKVNTTVFGETLATIIAPAVDRIGVYFSNSAKNLMAFNDELQGRTAESGSVLKALSGLAFEAYNNLSILGKIVIAVGGAFIAIKTGGLLFTATAKLIRAGGLLMTSVFKTIFSWPMLMLGSMFVFWTAFEHNWFGLADTLKETWGHMQDAWNGAYFNLTDIWSSENMNFLDKTMASAAQIISSAWAGITNGIDNSYGTFTEIWSDENMNFISKVFATAATAIKEVWEEINGYGQDAFDKLKSIWSSENMNFLEKAIETFKAGIVGIPILLQRVGETFSRLMGKDINGYLDDTNQVISEIKENLNILSGYSDGIKIEVSGLDRLGAFVNLTENLSQMPGEFIVRAFVDKGADLAETPVDNLINSLTAVGASRMLGVRGRHAWALGLAVDLFFGDPTGFGTDVDKFIIKPLEAAGVTLLATGSPQIAITVGLVWAAAEAGMALGKWAASNDIVSTAVINYQLGNNKDITKLALQELGSASPAAFAQIEKSFMENMERGGFVATFEKIIYNIKYAFSSIFKTIPEMFSEFVVEPIEDMWYQFLETVLLPIMEGFPFKTQGMQNWIDQTYAQLEKAREDYVRKAQADKANMNPAPIYAPDYTGTPVELTPEATQYFLTIAKGLPSEHTIIIDFEDSPKNEFMNLQNMDNYLSDQKHTYSIETEISGDDIPALSDDLTALINSNKVLPIEVDTRGAKLNLMGFNNDINRIGTMRRVTIEGVPLLDNARKAFDDFSTTTRKDMVLNFRAMHETNFGDVFSEAINKAETAVEKIKKTLDFTDIPIIDESTKKLISGQMTDTFSVLNQIINDEIENIGLIKEDLIALAYAESSLGAQSTNIFQFVEGIDWTAEIHRITDLLNNLGVLNTSFMELFPDGIVDIDNVEDATKAADIYVEWLKRGIADIEGISPDEVTLDQIAIAFNNGLDFYRDWVTKGKELADLPLHWETYIGNITKVSDFLDYTFDQTSQVLSTRLAATGIGLKADISDVGWSLNQAYASLESGNENLENSFSSMRGISETNTQKMNTLLSNLIQEADSIPDIEVYLELKYQKKFMMNPEIGMDYKKEFVIEPELTLDKDKYVLTPLLDIDYQEEFLMTPLVNLDYDEEMDAPVTITPKYKKDQIIRPNLTLDYKRNFNMDPYIKLNYQRRFSMNPDLKVEDIEVTKSINSFGETITEKTSEIYQNLKEKTSRKLVDANDSIDQKVNQLGWTLESANLEINKLGTILNEIPLMISDLSKDLDAEIQAMQDSIWTGSFNPKPTSDPGDTSFSFEWDMNKKAAGGYVKGAGTGTSDEVPAWLSNGEFVMNSAATKRFLPLLRAMNSNRFASGSTSPVGGLGTAQLGLQPVTLNVELGDAESFGEFFQIIGRDLKDQAGEFFKGMVDIFDDMIESSGLKTSFDEFDQAINEAEESANRLAAEQEAQMDKYSELLNNIDSLNMSFEKLIATNSELFNLDDEGNFTQSELFQSFNQSLEDLFSVDWSELKERFLSDGAEGLEGIVNLGKVKQPIINQTPNFGLESFSTAIGSATSFLGMFGLQLFGALMQVEQVNKILNPFSTIIDGIISVLTPIFTMLDPVVELLTAFGQIIGSVLNVFQPFFNVIAYAAIFITWVFDNITLAIDGVFRFLDSLPILGLLFDPILTEDQRTEKKKTLKQRYKEFDEKKKFKSTNEGTTFNAGSSQHITNNITIEIKAYMDLTSEEGIRKVGEKVADYLEDKGVVLNFGNN